MGRFRPSYSGIGELLRSEMMQQDMRRRAENVKRIAEATAPVYAKAKDPGEYKHSFEVESGVRATSGAGERAFGAVTNTSDHAVFVEYGTPTTPKHRTLFNALMEGARE